jgi:steroid 5-alpha reductase family enzyme
MANLAELDPYGLLTTAAITAVYQLGFFTVACACKVDKVTDFAGGTNFMVLALTTFFGFGSNPDFDRSSRQLIVTALASVWAVRLSTFLLYRILAWGEDRRFDDVRNDPLKFAVFWVYQALWVWTTMLNVTIVNTSLTSCSGPEPEDGCVAAPETSAVDYVGWALFAGGLVLETVADQTKLNFKSDLVASAGRWCARGVWSVSRHPNYCGELMCWWGIWLASWPVTKRSALTAALGLASPLFITVALLGVSGVTLLESSADQKYGHLDEYHDYKLSVPPLVPCPPPLYRRMPRLLKALLCFEMPCYSSDRLKAARAGAGAGAGGAKGEGALADPLYPAASGRGGRGGRGPPAT